MLKIYIYVLIISVTASIYAENDQYILLVSMDGFRADYLDFIDIFYKFDTKSRQN